MNNHHNDIEVNKELDEGKLPKATNPFQVPDAYFEHFAANILDTVKAAQGQDEPCSFTKELPFTTPPQYFDNLAVNITAQVRTADEIINGAIPWQDAARKLPYEAPPAGYFDNFVTNLEEILFESEDDIEPVSPLLLGLKEAQPLSIPDGYFDNNNLTATTVAKPATKVIEHPAIKSMRWSTWVAAAAILLIFTVGGWQFLGKSDAPAMSAEQMLAQVSTADIQKYITNNLEEFDINMLEYSASQSGKVNMNSNILSGISDEEIEAYLNGDI
jgi:hypothetical protein